MTMVPVTVSALCQKQTLALGPTRFGPAHLGELDDFTLLEELSMEAVLSTPDRKARRNPHSPVLKHSIRLAGNKTSISLENQFWDCLREIARGENIPVDTLIERIDTDRTRHNLSSAVRIFVLEHFRTRANRATLTREDLTASSTGPVL